MVTHVQRSDHQAPAPGSLEHLALEADQLDAQPSAPAAPPSAEELAQEAEAAKAVAAMEQAAMALVRKGLQAVRSRVSRSLPEISHHWADDDLQAVAAAAIPVGKKHLGRLMPLLGDYPEEAALAVAALPLVLGYAAALTEHDAKVAAAIGGAVQAASDQVGASNVVQLSPATDGG